MGRLLKQSPNFSQCLTIVSNTFKQKVENRLRFQLRFNKRPHVSRTMFCILNVTRRNNNKKNEAESSTRGFTARKIKGRFWCF